MRRGLVAVALAFALTALPAGAAPRADSPYPCQLCLFEVRIDGTGFRTLPVGNDRDVDDLSPDRTRLVYRSPYDNPPDRRLFVVPLDGTENQAVAPDGEGARFSPDGKKIAFTRLPPGARPDPPRCYRTTVWVVGSDGSGLRKIGGECATAPAWAPDSKRLAFLDRLAWTGTAARVAIFDGRAPRSIGLWENGSAEIEWAPRGDLLAYVTTAEPVRPHAIGGSAGGRAGDAPSELRVVRSNGSTVRTFQNAYGPGWSPDGGRIAFYHDDTPYEDVPFSYAAMYEGSLRVATLAGRARAEHGDCGNLVWSPDGRSIACTEFDDVLVVPAKGGKPRRVVRVAQGGQIRDLWWSRNGKRLLFTWGPG